MSTGTIIERKRKDGTASYLLKYDAGKDDNGRRRVAYATVRGTKKDAQKELRRLLREVDQGTHVDRSEKITVGEWVTRCVVNSKASRKTVERYRELARYIGTHIGEITLQQLRAEQIEDFYNTLRRRGGKDGAPLSPRTVRHVHRLLSSAVSAAVRLNKLHRNPLQNVEKISVPKSPAIPFEEHELQTLLSKLRTDQDWLYPVAHLAAATGMRRGELLALRWRDIDFERQTVHVRESIEETRGHGLDFKTPKNGKSRSLLVSRAALVELQTYHSACVTAAKQCGIELDGEALVFPASPALPAEPRKPRAVSEAFTDRLTKYKLKKKGLSLHSLRHTHATMLLRARVNVKIVSERLGHSSINITLETYAHVMPGDQEQAVQVMDGFFNRPAHRVELQPAVPVAIRVANNERDGRALLNLLIADARKGIAPGGAAGLQTR